MILEWRSERPRTRSDPPATLMRATRSRLFSKGLKPQKRKGGPSREMKQADCRKPHPAQKRLSSWSAYRPKDRSSCTADFSTQFFGSISLGRNPAGVPVALPFQQPSEETEGHHRLCETTTLSFASSPWLLFFAPLSCRNSTEPACSFQSKSSGLLGSSFGFGKQTSTLKSMSWRAGTSIWRMAAPLK